MKRSRSKIIKLLAEWELWLFILILSLFSAHLLAPFFGRHKVDMEAMERARGEEITPLDTNNDDEMSVYNQYALLEKANVITADIQPEKAGDAFFIYQSKDEDEDEDESDDDAKDQETDVDDKDTEEEPKKTEHEIEYCGKLRSPGGNEVALIKDVNSGKTVYREVNSKFLNLTIVDFNGYDLTVELPSGETETIFFNENFKFETIEK